MKRVNNKGFTLVEILVAIALLGVLMTLAAQAYNVYKKKARQQAYDTMAKTATTAATNYLMENAQSKYITFDTLKNKEFIDTLQDPKYRDEQCSGIVINKVVQGEEEKKLDILFQKVKLCCKDYKYQYDYTGDEVKVTEIDSCEYVEGDEIDGVYKLIYKPSGGTECIPGVVMKKQKEKWGDLCVTERENFAFKGWNTKKSGTGSTITKDTVVGDHDISVYAVWNEIFTLKYDEEGGTTCNPDFIRKENGEEWGDLCVTERENFVFKGWRTKRNGDGKTIITTSIAEENLTVYAHWNPYITIMLDSQGGSACEINSIRKEKGDEWGILCTPTRSGYVFKGWNTKADGKGTRITATTKADFNEDEESKYTIYAIWNPIYTLTYNSNGGSTCNPNSKSVENGKEWGKLCTTSLAGYTFTGWKDENGNVVTSTTKATKNTTLTAGWRANCPNGYTYQLNGTCKKTYDALKSYSCQNGGTLSGQICTIKSTYDAAKSYSCNSGDSRSGTTCTNKKTYTATTNYSCNTGDTRNNATCTSTSQYTATLNYSCNSGGTLSGTTCTNITTYNATSGTVYSNCRWDKDGGIAYKDKTKGLAYQAGAVWQKDFKTACTESNRGATQRVYDCGSGAAACWHKEKSSYDCDDEACYSPNYKVYSAKTLTCKCDSKTGYVCNNGGTLSGSTCTNTTTYNASQSYTCPNGGTLSGTSCKITSTYDAAKSYSCNSGDSRSGSTCTNTTTYTATTNYSCNAGDTRNNATCTNKTTYTATTNYSCNTGDTRNNETCTNKTTYTATPVYSCNSGDTINGTTCTSIVTP